MFDKQKPQDKTANTNGGVDASKIKPAMKVVCDNNDPFAVVDHMEGASTIKLQKDEKGIHHYIPLGWVTRVDSEVHIDRARSRAMQEWSATPAKS